MTPACRLLITAGPTREAIDPVRFISNASSGRQGVAIAREALKKGWQVDLVHGPLEISVPRGVCAHRVVSTAEMMAACKSLHSSCDALVAAAAVCDFRPRQSSDTKRKRAGSNWTLELLPTEDIAAELGREKGRRVHVGFALESDDGERNAAEKLARKNLDWIVLNDPSAIGVDAGVYTLLGARGQKRVLGQLRKSQLAAHLVGLIEEELAAR